jgi:hypothetical protein
MVWYGNFEARILRHSIWGGIPAANCGLPAFQLGGKRQSISGAGRRQYMNFQPGACQPEGESSLPEMPDCHNLCIIQHFRGFWDRIIRCFHAEHFSNP